MKEPLNTLYYPDYFADLIGSLKCTAQGYKRATVHGSMTFNVRLSAHFNARLNARLNARHSVRFSARLNARLSVRFRVA